MSYSAKDDLYRPEPEYFFMRSLSGEIKWPHKDGASNPTLGLTCSLCGWVHTRKRWTNRTIINCHCGSYFKFDYPDGWSWYPPRSKL